MNRRSLFAKIGSALGFLAAGGVATAAASRKSIDRLCGDSHVVFEPAIAGGFIVRMTLLVVRDCGGNVFDIIYKGDSSEISGHGKSMSLALSDLTPKIVALAGHKIDAIKWLDSYVNCGEYGFSDIRNRGDGLLSCEEGAEAKRRLWQHKMGPSA